MVSVQSRGEESHLGLCELDRLQEIAYKFGRIPVAVHEIRAETKRDVRLGDTNNGSAIDAVHTQAERRTAAIEDDDL